MDGNERIRAAMSEALRDLKEDLHSEENDMQKLESGLRIAITLYNTALRFSKGDNDAVSHIEILQIAFEQWYRDYKNVKSKNMAEWVEDVKPVIDVIKAYYELMDNIGDSTQTTALLELTKEEMEILTKPETENAILSDDPYLRATTQKSRTIANYGEKIGQLNIIERKGILTPYHAAVYDTAIKAYKNGKISPNGYIMLSENQAIRTLLGTTGTPSKAQKKMFYQAWEEMSQARIEYETTTEFAKNLGYDEAAVEKAYSDVKRTKTQTLESETLVKSFTVMKNKEIQGKKTNVYFIEPSEIMKYVLSKLELKWQEEIPKTIQRVSYIDGNGEFKDWQLSAQRITIRQYIYSWVYKKIRDRATGGAKYRLLLPYEKIFEDCCIDISHRQEKKRRTEDIETVLNYLQLMEVIAKWNQYYKKDGTLQGIEIFLYEMKYDKKEEDKQ